MRVLFTSLRNPSHFFPLVPFIEACARQGHDVAVAAPADLGERVAKTPARFLPFGHPGDAGLQPLWERMRQVEPSQRADLVIGEIFAGACAKAALPGLLEMLGSFRPDLVLRESQEYAGLVAARKLGIAHAHVAITLPSVEPTMFPHAAPSLEAHARTLGMPAGTMAAALAAEPVLTMFPEALERAGFSNPNMLRYRTGRTTHEKLPDYWPGQSGPLVYLTLGTVVGTMADLRSAYRIALDAVAHQPVRVLLTVGNELPLDTLGELPKNVHVERFVPQDRVLSEASAVIDHGGSGTVLGVLAAGVPQVIMPLFADQPTNAERVAALGAGVGLPEQGATAETLRAALTRVLSEESFRVIAQRVAAEMAALPSVDSAPADLTRLAGVPR